MLPLCSLSSSATLQRPHNTALGISVELKPCPNASRFYPSFRLKVNPTGCSLLMPISAATSVDIFCALGIRFHPQLIQSSHPGCQSSHPARRAHLLLSIASWDRGSYLRTSKWKCENCHECWENSKKGGHKFNGSTPSCVMQRISPLIISNTCITNEEALPLCVHLMHKQLFCLNQKWKLFVIFKCVVVHKIVHYCRNEDKFVDPQFQCSAKNERL